MLRLDDISFYAKMFRMAGFAAEGMHDVVIERQVAFEQNTYYENAEALSSAIEMIAEKSGGGTGLVIAGVAAMAVAGLGFLLIKGKQK